jgi:hypothetical protein
MPSGIPGFSGDWDILRQTSFEHEKCTIELSALLFDRIGFAVGQEASVAAPDSKSEKVVTRVRGVSKAKSKEEILTQFRLFSFGRGEGIGSWLTDSTDPEVFARLGRLESDPLPKVQLNQLLLLGHEASVSDGFFDFYWLSIPDHVYDVRTIPPFSANWLKAGTPTIKSLDHLYWGLYRLYVDGLLFYGNVRTAFRAWRNKSKVELQDYFNARRFNTQSLRDRGPALPLIPIPKDERYLISEMACKSYGASPAEGSDLKNALFQSFESHLKQGGGRITIRELLEGSKLDKGYASMQSQLILSADGILDQQVSTEADVKEKYLQLVSAFERSRAAALQNTKFYLSVANDLDVYVATSMRTRQDFRKMADTCQRIFSDDRLKGLNLRYFDPTLSAASGHEDKGLIECLMVKCAKALVYCAGEKESYGKDAEAAMALSLGKPVIFLCDQATRQKFYRDVHPLSRLIHFDTGVAVGAMVSSSEDEVSELLRRIFENQCEYELMQDSDRPGYLRLIERKTGSVVRLQTNDSLLRETFWNHYHNHPTQA